MRDVAGAPYGRECTKHAWGTSTRLVERMGYCTESHPVGLCSSLSNGMYNLIIQTFFSCSILVGRPFSGETKSQTRAPTADGDSGGGGGGGGNPTTPRVSVTNNTLPRNKRIKARQLRCDFGPFLTDLSALYRPTHASAPATTRILLLRRALARYISSRRAVLVQNRFLPLSA